MTVKQKIVTIAIATLVSCIISILLSLLYYMTVYPNYEFEFKIVRWLISFGIVIMYFKKKWWRWR